MPSILMKRPGNNDANSDGTHRAAKANKWNDAIAIAIAKPTNVTSTISAGQHRAAKCIIVFADTAKVKPEWEKSILFDRRQPLSAEDVHEIANGCGADITVTVKELTPTSAIWNLECSNGWKETEKIDFSITADHVATIFALRGPTGDKLQLIAVRIIKGKAVKMRQEAGVVFSERHRKTMTYKIFDTLRKADKETIVLGNIGIGFGAMIQYMIDYRVQFGIDINARINLLIGKSQDIMCLHTKTTNEAVLHLEPSSPDRIFIVQWTHDDANSDGTHRAAKANKWNNAIANQANVTSTLSAGEHRAAKCTIVFADTAEVKPEWEKSILFDRREPLRTEDVHDIANECSADITVTVKKLTPTGAIWNIECSNGWKETEKIDFSITADHVATIFALRGPTGDKLQLIVVRIIKGKAAKTRQETGVVFSERHRKTMTYKIFDTLRKADKETIVLGNIGIGFGAMIQYMIEYKDEFGIDINAHINLLINKSQDIWCLHTKTTNEAVLHMEPSSPDRLFMVQWARSGGSHPATVED
jgi:predicted RNA-binding protein Jag